MGVKSIEEINERIASSREMLEDWKIELKNALAKSVDFRDEGYIDHCRTWIAELKADINALLWVTNQEQKI